MSAARWLPALALVAWAAGAAPVRAQDAAAEPARPEPTTSAATTSRTPELQVIAPDALRKLLERHLDLARAIADQQGAAPASSSPSSDTAGADSAAGAENTTSDSGIGISDVEWSRLIAAAPGQAKSLVQTEGYFAAKAQVERDGRIVRLTLEPGPIARVGQLVVDFQGELAEALERRDRQARELHDELMDRWALPVGAAFRNSDWSDAKTAVIARLRAEGYAAATWSGTSAEVMTGDDPASTEAPKVSIFAVVDTGPLFRAGGEGSIGITGINYHDAERVRALAGFEEGAALTETRLLDYQERLLRTGLFDQAAVSLDPDAAMQGESRVLVQVKEAPLQNATTGLGYGTTTGPRATLEYTHRRVFGWAATARNKFEVGRDRKAWDGEISSHPNALMQRYLVGGTYELLKTSEDRVISQRLRFGRSEDLPQRERLAFIEFERSNECSYDGGACVDPLTLKAASANLHNTWRRLDNAVLPTRGTTLNVQVGAGWATGLAPTLPAADRPESGPFTRLYGRVTGYKPLPNGFFSEGRLELGGVLTKHEVVVPDSQRFRAGGDDSVRGYDYRTLAPETAEGGVTGGKLLFTASAEIAHPVSRDLPSVWWAAFVDAGRAADSVKELNPAFGYGVGARWRSPVGPLKLDLAYGQELKQWRVHLSVGIAF
ncbi:BamA/TamA family outer membrane protein [Ideonella sp. DXS29W]|uniref:BamA/TamA family outer membrane protein n=1 Tax=Ideonella lacteola TaxID=2984193 RepID=A0ABU9BN33_9BURK